MQAGHSAVILSQKEFNSAGIASQKNAGWVYYFKDGTWAWNMGSGKRRITHARENGLLMPINDNKWHQLTMTYNSDLAEIRLYYDGNNKAIYQIGDSVGFPFTNTNDLIVGSKGNEINIRKEIIPEIEAGAEKLQQLVNEFNKLNKGNVAPGELEELVIDPKKLLSKKINASNPPKGSDSGKQNEESLKQTDLTSVLKIRSELMRNPYTIYQASDFMEAAPLHKLYSLSGEKIVLNHTTARSYSAKEKLQRPDFSMDNLGIWDYAMNSDEVLISYAKYFKPTPPFLARKQTRLIAADWNIWHGAKHFTTEKNGFDARDRIVEILKQQKADVVMMQETYSAGEYIAAELGYYFATTVDWDYLNQGANLSVFSRYPIKELYVPKGAPFMNVAVKIAVSHTQDMYVMSNWYGMQKFPEVFGFHQKRFQESDSIPVLFAGDFNTAPHVDGGESPASEKLTEAGFTDAYRNLHPDKNKFPGFTHTIGERIDQLYYKGEGLKNTSTEVITTWPTGFPSDHYLIISRFDLNYSTRK